VNEAGAPLTNADHQRAYRRRQAEKLARLEEAEERASAALAEMDQAVADLESANASIERMRAALTAIAKQLADSKTDKGKALLAIAEEGLK